MGSLELQTLLKNFPEGHPEELLPILQAIQEQEGSIPEASLRILESYCGVPSSRIFGIISFFDGLNIESPERWQSREP